MEGAVREKILGGVRLTKHEAVSLFKNGDLLTLGSLANAKRRGIHPEPVVTYIIDRNINYTNICVSGCKFCAFHRKQGSSDAFVLTWNQLDEKIEETLELGGVQILLQGGLHPTLKIDFYEEMLSKIKSHYPIHIHGLSPPEIVHVAKISQLSVRGILNRLVHSGLNSIPGGGAEILVDKVRKAISPNKCSSLEWLEVMEEAHRLGLKTTATMMFGHVETVEDRVDHLLKIRDLQERTGGFTAFIPWPFQPKNTRLNDIKPSTGVDYLKTLALSRLVLDNVPNIQASWVTQGPKVAQVALHFGANDLGSTMIEENVVSATGVYFGLSREDMIHLIQDAGFRAQKRNMLYEWLD